MRLLEQVISEAAADAGLPAADVQRLAVAVQEILTNAIVHGGGQAAVRVHTDRSRVSVTVTDKAAPWIAVIPSEPPDASRQSGRGLWLADALCDSLSVTPGPGGTTIRIIMQIRREPQHSPK